MTLIHVPKPPRSALNPHRPVSSLLTTQIEHFYLAEKRLPLRYRTGIYTNAIRTEAEAARYIREVTDAIHRAHDDAARLRARKAPRRTRVIDIAAVADDRPVAESSDKAHSKKEDRPKEREEEHQKTRFQKIAQETVCVGVLRWCYGLRRRWRWLRKAECRHSFAGRVNAWPTPATSASRQWAAVRTRCLPTIRCTLRPGACLRRTGSAWAPRSSPQGTQRTGA